MDIGKKDFIDVINQLEKPRRGGDDFVSRGIIPLISFERPRPFRRKLGVGEENKEFFKTADLLSEDRLITLGCESRGREETRFPEDLWLP